MRQYSIDNIELTWLGLDFKEGLAAGTSIQEARSVQSFTMKPQGAIPKIVRVYDPNSSGTVTVTVDQEAQLHQQLTAIHNADRNPSTRNQVGNMVLQDNSSGERITYRNAYISSQPDLSRGVESATFAWVFHFESYEKIAVDTLANVVGN